MPPRADKAAVHACQQLSRSLQHCSTEKEAKDKATKCCARFIPRSRSSSAPTSHSLPTQDFSSSLKGRITFQLQLKTSLQRAAELYKDLPLIQEYLKKKKPTHPRNLEVILPVLLQPGSPPPPY